MIETALMCLALNVYMESRSEPLSGQHAVAQVTMNRADRNPENICKVVTKHKQFSWTTDSLRKVKGKGRYALKKKAEPKDKKAWAIAVSIARVTLSGWTKDFTGGSKHYHTVAVKPRWRLAMRPWRIIGSHIFYYA